MSRLSLLLTLCLLFTVQLVSITVAAGEVDDPDVVVLTDDNFEGFIQNDLVLVEFYAPVSHRERGNSWS